MEAPRRGARATGEGQVAALAARPRVEDGTLELVSTRRERALELGDEDAENGVVRARVHLRDEEDPHGALKLAAAAARA
jgi:hypothetical protein